MIDNPVIFYSAAFMIIAFALAALFSRNVIYSLLASVCVFFLGALFFYILGSEYNAIIQAAIYGLAVPVILGISIMFRGKYGQKQKMNRENSLCLILCLCVREYFVLRLFILL